MTRNVAFTISLLKSVALAVPGLCQKKQRSFSPLDQNGAEADTAEDDCYKNSLYELELGNRVQVIHETQVLAFGPTDGSSGDVGAEDGDRSAITRRT